jgi:3-deoxy-D-manno-octulosonic-acid transferase
MRNRMIRLLYNLLWPIGLLFFLPRYLVKMFRRGDYRENFGQRLGWYHIDLRVQLAEQKPIWLHAVSVGEVGIALRLAAEMRRLQPNLRCVLTTTTTTGFSFAKRNAPAWIAVMYNPLDFWPIMRRALFVIQPEKIVLIEAEIWPNLVAEARARRIPIALANARLSPRSEKRFRFFRFFVAPTFRLLDLVCVQEAEDVDRWVALGVDRRRIHCTGSIKFDSASVSLNPTSPEQILREHKIDKERPIFLAGSTHAGEEEVLARIFVDLREKFPNLFLIIAPRHAERAREVQRVLEQHGLRTAFRSQSVVDQPRDCLILDSTGELPDWYAVATAVFVGKSLSGHGGQNPVEPIMAGKPVLFGPHMENFAALARSLIAQRGAVEVHSADELENAVVDLLRDRDLRESLVKNARGVIAKHRGAATVTAKLIDCLAPPLDNPLR